MNYRLSADVIPPKQETICGLRAQEDPFDAGTVTDVNIGKSLQSKWRSIRRAITGCGIWGSFRWQGSDLRLLVK
jgi:hypothetical protein